MDAKISKDSVSYMGYTKGDKESSSGGKSSNTKESFRKIKRMFPQIQKAGAGI